MLTARFILALCASLLCAATLGAADFAITDVRIFDGSEVLDRGTVVVRDGRIAAVGESVPVPAGLEVVDGAGKTLLPGLIDCHTHSWGDALERSAVFGVTTVLDMFTEPGWAAARRGEQAAGTADGRADLFSAGVLATAPGGHGTQYGIEVPTLTAPEQVEGWVADRVAEGSDFIKIVIEDGSLVGRPLATLEPPTVAALARAARARGKLAVAHATSLAAAEVALAAPVDGLVHLFRDAPAPAAWVETAARRELFVVPTLTVLESTMGRASGAALAEDPRLRPHLKSSEIANLGQSFPAREGVSMSAAFTTIRALAAAEVRILAGTDAPNPGTAHGVSMHRELELLVEAGLTPAAALAAATATAAETFGLADRGRIAPGRRADLLLVDGDPLADITATRAIAAVWKGGEAIARPEVGEASHPVRGPGPLADFETGALAAAFGFGWGDSTDDIMGGKSTVALEVIAAGAAGSAHALEVTGEIQPGFAYPWAGAMFLAGEAPMAPVDLSAVSELVFWTKGDPGTYRVMAFAESLGQMPSQASFEVTAEWRQVVLPLASFRGAEPGGMKGLLWSGGPQPGRFRLVLDQIELR